MRLSTSLIFETRCEPERALIRTDSTARSDHNPYYSVRWKHEISPSSVFLPTPLATLCFYVPVGCCLLHRATGRLSIFFEGGNGGTTGVIETRATNTVPSARVGSSSETVRITTLRLDHGLSASSCRFGRLVGSEV